MDVVWACFKFLRDAASRSVESGKFAATGFAVGLGRKRCGVKMAGYRIGVVDTMVRGEWLDGESHEIVVVV